MNDPQYSVAHRPTGRGDAVHPDRKGLRSRRGFLPTTSPAGPKRNGVRGERQGRRAGRRTRGIGDDTPQHRVPAVPSELSHGPVPHGQGRPPFHPHSIMRGTCPRGGEILRARPHSRSHTCSARRRTYQGMNCTILRRAPMQRKTCKRACKCMELGHPLRGRTSNNYWQSSPETCRFPPRTATGCSSISCSSSRCGPSASMPGKRLSRSSRAFGASRDKPRLVPCPHSSASTNRIADIVGEVGRRQVRRVRFVAFRVRVPTQDRRVHRGNRLVPSAAAMFAEVCGAEAVGTDLALASSIEDLR